MTSWVLVCIFGCKNSVHAEMSASLSTVVTAAWVKGRTCSNSKGALTKTPEIAILCAQSLEYVFMTISTKYNSSVRYRSRTNMQERFLFLFTSDFSLPFSSHCCTAQRQWCGSHCSPSAPLLVGSIKFCSQSAFLALGRGARRWFRWPRPCYSRGTHGVELGRRQLAPACTSPAPDLPTWSATWQAVAVYSSPARIKWCRQRQPHCVAIWQN